MNLNPIEYSEWQRKTDPVRTLKYCYRCHENSVARQVYTRKDGSKHREEHCINKGCGYKDYLGRVK